MHNERRRHEHTNSTFFIFYPFELGAVHQHTCRCIAELQMKLRNLLSLQLGKNMCTGFEWPRLKWNVSVWLVQNENAAINMLFGHVIVYENKYSSVGEKHIVPNTL